MTNLLQAVGALPWAQYVRATYISNEEGGNDLDRCVMRYYYSTLNRKLFTYLI